ncbi:MAG TPA: hypothetical protein VHF89_00090 [Solirubrobacteraceae bacterium]|nr:hypothetical protein [Solirubrobacteraceae bacterium]
MVVLALVVFGAVAAVILSVGERQADCAQQLGEPCPERGGRR